MSHQCQESERRGAGGPGGRGLGVSGRCYEPRNLIHFCQAAKSEVALEKRDKGSDGPTAGVSEPFQGLKQADGARRASLWHKAQNGRSPRSALREDRIQDGAADVAETGSDLRMMPNSLMDGDTTARSGGGQCGKCWVLVHIQGFGAQMLLSDVFFLGNDHLYAGMRPAGLFCEPGKRSP